MIARALAAFLCSALLACTDEKTLLQLRGPVDAGAPAGACRSDPDCAPLRCDEGTGACVQCTANAHCASRLCDLTTQQCKGCKSDLECSGDTPHCDDDDGRCVECTRTAECGPGEVCEGTAHACAARCRSNADCAGTNRVTCALSAGVCVECATSAECAAPLPLCQPRDGSCVECLSDEDCPDKHCSLEYQCHTCHSAADCDVGQHCLDGDCRY